MDDARRTGPFLLVLLLLFQTMAMIPAAANPTGGTVNTFSNGQAEASVALTAGTIDASLGIEVPRNVTFDSASFVVNAKDETPTPGQVYIDIGQDGVKEWAFEGTGYGNLGHQQSFITGNTVDSVYSSGYVSSSMIHIPHGASIGSVDLDVNFTSAVAGGLVPTGIVEASTSGDMDNDTLPEIAVLSTTVTGFNAAISRIDWNASTGLNMSSWVATCAGATELSMADFNGDGMDDVVSFDYTSSNACVHFTNSTTASLGAAQLVVLNSNSIQASAGDFNQDGNADIISIHSGGIFSLRTFNAKVGSFGANQTYTVNMNNTATPTTLLYLTAGHFDANASTYSAVVTDFSGHSTPLQWTAGSGISDNPAHFDGIQSQPIAGDIDNDGDIDFLGTNQIGYTIALNTGSQWNTTDVLSTSELASASALNNASFFDHDGDGVTSLIVPRATGDCNVINPSLCGNLSIFDINSTSIGAQSGALQPWDAPMDADGVDMDGDGVLEHIVAAGNGTHGLFIGPYSTIGMDINLDGQTDLSASGYSGSAQFAMDPLSIEDPMGNMTSILSPLMNALPYIEDGYGVRMSTTNFDFTSTTNGTFDLSNMDIGYDIDFIVENNPFSAGNLTNIINQQQTAGVGNFVVSLPVNATMSGTFTLSGLIAQYSPGAPNLSLPPTPTVTLTELTSDRVQIEWQDMLAFGDDLIEFEVFRSSPGVPFDLTSPYTIAGANMSVDGDVEHGTTYVYGVRSLHDYGVTSNMSIPLTVTVPFPAPPAAVAGFTVVDTPSDEGGSLDFMWNISIDGAVEYRAYLETQSIQNLSGLQPIATIAHTTDHPTMSLSTADEGITTIDGVEYYAAVVAFDGYGNSTSAFSTLGPVVSLNNSQRTAHIDYDLSTSGDFDQDQFGISALDSIHLNITLTSDGIPLAGEPLYLTIEAMGVDVELSGSTDASGVWQAIAVEDLTELGGPFTTFFDTATMTIDYLGTNGSSTMQPVAPVNRSIQGLGLLRADVAAGDTVLEIDDAGVFSLEVTLTAELPTQNTYLEGLAYTWEQRDADGNTTSTGMIEVKGGELVLTGTANATDTLVLTSDPTKSWIHPSLNPISFTFIGSPEEPTNETDANETTNGTEPTGPTFPDTTLPALIDCGTATYAWEGNGTDEAITCTITNPNPFDVFVGFSWKVIPATPPTFTFESSSLTGSGPTLTISAEGSTQVEFLPVRNGPSDGLFPGAQGVEYIVYITCSELGGANQCDAMSAPTASIEGELQWTLGEQPEVVQPVDTTPTETKSSAPLVIGGIIGILVLIAGGAAVILLRNAEEEDDDWYADSIEEEESEVVEKPTKPTSKSLDELHSEGKTLDDVEGPKERRPSLFDEFDNNNVESFDESEVTELEEKLGEEEEDEESHDEAEEDDGISVDENGTEWWEDEEGVWWYREEGWEDWAVWEE
ncbi:MAG: hypothetical protein CMB19_05630 [Euryarchaeota archaeon]|nr:hypothetical protein [Euryarchaeota archaeon]